MLSPRPASDVANDIVHCRPSHRGGPGCSPVIGSPLGHRVKLSSPRQTRYRTCPSCATALLTVTTAVVNTLRRWLHNLDVSHHGQGEQGFVAYEGRRS